MHLTAEEIENMIHSLHMIHSTNSSSPPPPKKKKMLMELHALLLFLGFLSIRKNYKESDNLEENWEGGCNRKL